MKVLREGNIDARRGFSDEGRLLANLRDPHLVRVLAVGETEDGAPYMALEYLDGPSLEGRLRVRGGRWSTWRGRWGGAAPGRGHPPGRQALEHRPARRGDGAAGGEAERISASKWELGQGGRVPGARECPRTRTISGANFFTS